MGYRDSPARKLIDSVLATVMLLGLSGAVSTAADLIGQASIIDGDTLEIQGTRIRLWGIDAPDFAIASGWARD